jgi:predicted O-methyltransferase YrrM
MALIQKEVEQRTLDLMDTVEGYFHRDEGAVLLETAARAVTEFQGAALVEVGSYCGKSTVALGTAAVSLGGKSKVYAIDPHEGEMSGVGRCPPSELKFIDTMQRSGLSRSVELIKKRSYQTKLEVPIGLLFIDGLHDYENSRRDYLHFDRLVVSRGYVVFHDYAGCFPGVMKWVDELTAARRLVKESVTVSLAVLRKIS